MGVENLNELQDKPENGTESLEPQHSLAETPPVDPAEEFKAPDEVPGDRDDVDVPLAEMKTDTDDGKGEEEVPEADFQGYADSSADKEDSN